MAADDLSDRLAAGRAAFNRGSFFEAHELWEDIWLTTTGTERVCVQGLIQIAAGFFHASEGRPLPAKTLLRKGIEKLSTHASRMPRTLNTPALLAQLAARLAAWETADRSGSGVADLSAVKF